MSVFKPRLGDGLGPFTAIAVAVAFLLVLLPSPERHYGELALAALLGLGLVLVAQLTHAAPRVVAVVVPLGYIGLAALLRAAEGGSVSGFAGLFLLPVLWFALSPGRGELALGLVAVGVALILPLIVQGSPEYPASGWRGAVVLLAVAVIAGFTIQTLLIESQRRAVELERANGQLAEQNRLKEQFVALAAHELRTPVTTIYGFATTLQRRGGELSPERRTAVEDALAGQSIRMATLVEQLLDLSRLDAEAIEIAPRQVNVLEQIESLLPAVGDGVRDVRVEVPGSLEAELDPQAFERIVTNLLTNALRYGSPPFVVRAEEADGRLRVVVEDHGAGVPDAFVPSLFERFSRSDDSRRIASGTGLGLAIARSYARAHHGDLVYESVAPTGARFELSLPLRAEDRDAARRV